MADVTGRGPHSMRGNQPSGKGVAENTPIPAIHRAGPVTTLVTVKGWYDEQLLAQRDLHKKRRPRHHEGRRGRSPSRSPSWCRSRG